METDRKLYELSYLISPALSEEEALNFHQKTKNSLLSYNGIIENDGNILKRKLSYPIKKMREAYFAHFRFLAPAEKITDFKNQLRNPEILRSLIVETKNVPQNFIPREPKKPPETKIVEESPVAVKIPAQTTELEPVSNIEEIDKKLEEILGK
ncbi:30S ribosomal protein S6 [Candidatus Giovannonibacteria bacterium]|nr:30S ribosomal protein S6 [Candidatus Giovannonibacteria bacterium]